MSSGGNCNTSSCSLSYEYNPGKYKLPENFKSWQDCFAWHDKLPEIPIEHLRGKVCPTYQ